MWIEEIREVSEGNTVHTVMVVEEDLVFYTEVNEEPVTCGCTDKKNY